MSKNLCTRERKRRELFNRYKSLENKMHGPNLIWWDSLSMEAKYSLLFKWISFKHTKKDKSIKKFINLYKRTYRPTTSSYRNALIEHIIK